MEGMFHGAAAFNGDITTWDVRRVTSTSRMFFGATSFRRVLCWDLAVYATRDSMFTGSGGSLASYPACLTGGSGAKSIKSPKQKDPLKKSGKNNKRPKEDVKSMKKTKQPVAKHRKQDVPKQPKNLRGVIFAR
jgi:hypothetical protein